MPSKIPDDVLNKKLYQKIKDKIRSTIKNRRWGVYDSARLVREYKEQGGKYNKDKKDFGTDRWFKEKWIDACTWLNKNIIKPCGRSDQENKEKIRYCRPLNRITNKTPKTVKEIPKEELKRRCEQKRKYPNKRVTGKK